MDGDDSLAASIVVNGGQQPVILDQKPGRNWVMAKKWKKNGFDWFLLGRTNAGVAIPIAPIAEAILCVYVLVWKIAKVIEFSHLRILHLNELAGCWENACCLSFNFLLLTFHLR